MNSFSQHVVFAISKSPSGMWGFLVEDTQWEGKNSRGNVEAKELICMTHGHELKQGIWVGGGVQGRGE